MLLATRAPWALAFLAALFDASFHEMLEMRYLWQETVLLDNAKLVAFLGQEPHTPLDEAVRETLAAQGCLLPGKEKSSAPVAATE